MTTAPAAPTSMPAPTSPAPAIPAATPASTPAPTIAAPPIPSTVPSSVPLPPIPVPTSYKDIVYPSDKVEQLVDDIATNQIRFPANDKTGLLIHGEYGTGKTTLAKLLPNSMILPRGEFLQHIGSSTA